MTSFFGKFQRIACVVAAGSVIGACGQASSQGAPLPTPRAETTADATLTTVPPLNQEYPELFNEQGCAITNVTPALDDLSAAAQKEIIESLPPAAQAQIEANGQVNLDAIPPEQFGALLDAQGTEVADCNMTGETPRSPSEFYGYVGQSAHRIEPGTVRANPVATPDQSWRVLGLAAAPPNGGGAISITARLVDAAGSELGRTSSSSPVRGARPGEPVPFELALNVPAASVANVEYSVTAIADSVGRALVITIEDVLVDGNDSVVLGSVNNPSDAAIVGPSGVAAIVGTDGHLVDIIEFVVNEPGSSRVLPELRPGLSGTFDVRVSDPTHSLTTDGVEAWAFGS